MTRECKEIQRLDSSLKGHRKQAEVKAWLWSRAAWFSVFCDPNVLF